MQYQKDLTEGLRCTLQTVALLEKKRDVWELKCPCGLETFKIGSETLREELGETWHQLVGFHELAKQWKSQLATAKDFVDYQKRLTGLRRKRHAKNDAIGLLGAMDGSFTLKCSKCGRSYRFAVRLESPLELEKELTVIEAYEKLGFDLNSAETKKVLERKVVTDKNKGYHDLNSRQELVEYIDKLKADRVAVEAFLTDLADVTKKHVLQSELGQALAESVASSVEEIRKDFLKENKIRLEKTLESVASYCEELLMVTVEG